MFSSTNNSSPSITSKPAPDKVLLSKAFKSASVSTSPPRAVFIRRAPFLNNFNESSFIICSVYLLSGTCKETISDVFKSSSKLTYLKFINSAKNVS